MLNARMSGVRHTAAESEEAQTREQVGVVPIGIPLLAGPGAISTAILYSHKGKGWLDMVVLLGEIWLVAALVYRAAAGRPADDDSRSDGDEYRQPYHGLAVGGHCVRFYHTRAQGAAAGPDLTSFVGQFAAALEPVDSIKPR